MFLSVSMEIKDKQDCFLFFENTIYFIYEFRQETLIKHVPVTASGCSRYWIHEVDKTTLHKLATFAGRRRNIQTNQVL